MNYDFLKEFNIFIDVTIEDNDVDAMGIVDLDKCIFPVNEISFGVSCFKSATSKKIKRIILPSNTQRIGKKCFSEISFDVLDLSRAIFVGIDPQAFSGAKMKKVIALPNLINTALCNCSKEVFFKYDKTDEIEFSSCDYYKSLAFDEGFTHIHFKGGSSMSVQSLSLPSTLKEITSELEFCKLRKLNGIEKTQITSIPDKFLYKNKYIKKIELPPTVKHIGKSAFSYMDELDIEFSRITNLKTIDADAFLRTRITNGTLNFPMGLESIGENAFYSCVIDSVYFPATVMQISNHAFQSNYLTEVMLASTAITEVEDYAFAENGITKFTLPPYCFTIGEGAFRYNNIDVSKLCLNDISVGVNAFANNAT